MKTKLILIFLFSFYLISNAQKAPMRFGKVEMSDMEMKVYEKDSLAPAVILCDYGYYNGQENRFTRLLRIKILKKEGYQYADWIFPTASKTNIRGITYNLEDGLIVKEKLKKQTIYKERITEDYYKMRVAMPNAKVGSVMDIEFVHYGIPFEWRFQETIPVVWSELILGSSQYIKYQKNFFGFESLHIIEDNRWIAKDMPAFKKEPFMNSISNYITKFEFDVSYISFPGFYKSIANSWDAIAKLLYENTYFGRVITNSNYLNSVAKDIREKKLTEKEKIEAAFNAIKKIKWNKKNRLFTSSTYLRYVFKHELGNSADINLALFQLLKKLDFNTRPVILSTRKNGMLSPVYPSLYKLNHVIVYVKTNNNTYLLDATEKYLPYDILPKKCLNWNGIVITKKSSTWFDLMATKKDKKLIYYDLDLKDDLTFVGNINCRNDEYAAYDFRKLYYSFNSNEEYIKDFVKNKSGLKIIESSYENLDSIKFPVKEKYSTKISNQVNQIGDEYYFYPLLYEQLKENPFKTEKRNYPVDFAYQKQETVIVKITIPEDFEIVEIPETIKMYLNKNSANFIYQINAQDNNIILNFKYTINKELFSSDEYADLKEFFNQIIIKHSQPIILKKKI